jgi:hypothetical protein
VLDPADEQTLRLLRTQLVVIGQMTAKSGQMAATKDSTREAGIAELGKAVGLFQRAYELQAPDEEATAFAGNAGNVLKVKARIQQLQMNDTVGGKQTYLEAIDWFRKSEAARVRAAAAGKVDPEMSEAEAALDHVKNLLSCFASIEDTDSTLAYAARVIDLDPQWRDGYQYVAAALRQRGSKPEEALRYLVMWQCLEKSVQPVPDVGQHMAGLLSRYKPTDEIVNFSMTAQEPEEIRVYREGDQNYEAWISWTKGQALTFVNGRKMGAISFKPVAVKPSADEAAAGQASE